MKEKKLLPIGSVVSVENLDHRFIIVGHMRKQIDSGRLWDYAALPFPEGVMDEGKFFMFNSKQITSVYFIGLQDVESLEYLKSINALINENPLDFITDDEVE